MLTQRMTSVLRKLIPILASGSLLQAGSCDATLNQAAADLTTTIVGAVINNLVFGAFNLTT